MKRNNNTARQDSCLYGMTSPEIMKGAYTIIYGYVSSYAQTAHRTVGRAAVTTPTTLGTTTVTGFATTTTSTIG